ncbi:histidine kinase [Streptomyces sp. NBS 14/10]|uniref:sensor histidine kinase n=1 Tax=Streptomyces sp. NBS 14/10 TaxID=1945643 RepID=UPI000B7EA0AB|nr:histidine kinase [Streptomyces sp. NBS 14/10]KAK1179472.1 histidine kinase [Streptomyces sp. NBS 14/10]NUS82063.1 histidine kinase [Streptomyces sp.]
MQGTSLPGDAGSDSARHRDDLAPRLAVVITAVVLVGYFCVAVTYVVDARPSGRALDAALLMLALLPVLAALLGLQLTHSFPGLAPRLSGARHWTLALQALLTFLPFAVFKHAWLGMPGFLAGSSLLVLPPPLSWVAFAAIMGCTDVLLFQVGFGWGEVAYTTVSTALTGLVVFGLSRLSGLVAEVSRSRAELARLAVAQERLRFARDLHDLLGYSLSTITLKCELVHRLVPPQNSRAQQELAEILQTSRQALADVRAVASGYRKMSLSAEAGTAKSMLAAVGISTTAEVDCGELPDLVDTVLASVLREGLTNVLRHSKAEHCTIEARRSDRTVLLTLTNDGVGKPSTILRADSSDRSDGGSGIGNLKVRLENLGGRLRAGLRDDGRFELRAELELPVDSAPEERERGSEDEYGPAVTA